MTVTTKDILEGVRARLDKPEAWIKQSTALDAKGCPVGPNDPEAVCWCLGGAIVAEIGVHFGPDWWTTDNIETKRLDGEVRSAILQGQGVYRYVTSLNDAPSTTHEVVLDSLDRTITRL